MIKVTVWNEYYPDNTNPHIESVYPGGIQKAIADFLAKDGRFDAKEAIISQPEHGLTEEVLKNTDVLIWWAHTHHNDVSDEISKRVIAHVQKGMGVIFLHSAHMAKPFRGLLGTSGSLQWREAEERERVWTTAPSHPIAMGVPESFVLEHEEMYGEPFDIPEPETTVFIGWFKGGNVFRSGVTYSRGMGRVFYFQPGHETHESFYDKNVQLIIKNACVWAAPRIRLDEISCPNVKAYEEL